MAMRLKTKTFRQCLEMKIKNKQDIHKIINGEVIEEIDDWGKICVKKRENKSKEKEEEKNKENSVIVEEGMKIENKYCREGRTSRN